MTFSFNQEVHLCHVRMRTHNYRIITPLSICYALILSSCAPLQLPQSYHVTASHSHPSPGDNHQRTRGPFERTLCRTKEAEWNSTIYIYTRARHSFLSFALSRSLLDPSSLCCPWPFTPHILTSLGLCRTHPPFILPPSTPF